MRTLARGVQYITANARTNADVITPSEYSCTHSDFADPYGDRHSADGDCNGDWDRDGDATSYGNAHTGKYSNANENIFSNSDER